MNANAIIDILLKSEGYVPFDTTKYNKFHFTVCRLVKEEIRLFKWTEAERGRVMTWEQAVNEWMELNFEKFLEEVIPASGVRRFCEHYANKCKSEAER